MRNQLEKRLAQLKTELSSGEQVLSELQQKQQALEESLFRIRGAIQVLEDLLANVK